MKAQIINLLKASLKNELSDYNENLIIRAALLPYEGKTINARIVLPAGYQYTIAHNRPAVIAPSGNTHFICFDEQKNNFNITHFDVANSPYGSAAKTRADQLQILIGNPDELIRRFAALNKAYKAFATASRDIMSNTPFGSYHNPAYYAILKVLNIPNEVISKMQYPK